jgi:hypothetical protein
MGRSDSMCLGKLEFTDSAIKGGSNAYTCLLHLNVNNITSISTLLLIMPSTDRHQRIDDDGRDCI